MKLEIVAKNYSESQKLRDTIAAKLSKLDRYFYDDAVARVGLEKIGNTEKYRMEITIKFGGKILRVEHISDNMYENITVLEPKLERQIRKNRTRLASKIRQDVEVDQAEEKAISIFKVKEFELSQLSAEDAAAEMEMSGHDFYIYICEDTGKINVVYKRDDGEVGLLAPKY